MPQIFTIETRPDRSEAFCFKLGKDERQLLEREAKRLDATIADVLRLALGKYFGQERMR